MFIQKNNIFLELTKNQKSFLVSYLKNYTKKNEANSTSEILYSFIDDETYYFEIGNPHFEWIIPMLEQQKFLDELKCLIAQYKFQLEQKERQRPFLEKQKEFAKRERKKQQEYKLSKELPTEKQIKYYNS